MLTDFTIISGDINVPSSGSIKFRSSKLGILFVSSSVNTDAKYLFKIFALSWSHVVGVPFSAFKAPIVDS